MLKVTKFGGSSVAGGEQFQKVKAIVEADPSRRIVVVSAAGKREHSRGVLSERTSQRTFCITYGRKSER